MIHPKTSVDLAKNIADMAHDIWQSRHSLNLPVYFCFRVDVSYYKNCDINDDDYFYEKTETFYVHYVIRSKNKWYYTISDLSQFHIDHEELIFFDNEKKNYRGESYRYYAFYGLLEKDILKKYKEVTQNFDNISQITIWNMFPVCEFIGKLT